MYGLINTGASKKQQAMYGFQKSASDENNRNIANENIKQAESAQKKTNASTGAATGASNMGLGAASIGASALASGGIGLAAGLLLSELF